MSHDNTATELADHYVFPASRAQQQLFYLQHLAGDSSAYHVPLFFELLGPVDETALCRAVTAAVGRHEALRTRFQIVDGSLRQVIEPEQALPWSVTSCATRQELDELLDREAQRPFDLEAGPLVRAGLARCPTSGQVLWLAMHHIVTDGWSMTVVLEEIAEYYGDLLQGRVPKPAGPAFHYADYAAWQEEWLQSREADQQRAYWADRLAAPLPVLRLPADNPPDGVGDAARTHLFELPGELTTALRELGRPGEGSLFSVLLAGYAVLLASSTGVGDVIVGTPVANRSHSEFERTVGLFVNTVAVRAQVDRTLSFRDLLASVRAAAIGALDNANLPFEEVVDLVNPARGLDADPIFQVLFTFGAGPSKPVAAGGLTLRPVLRETQASKYQLMLEIDDRGDRVAAAWEGRAELFSADRLAELATRLVEQLGKLAGQPDVPIAQLVPLPAEAPAIDQPAIDQPVDDDWPAEEYQAPRTPLERRLVELWQEVLGVVRIGVADNFYLLGGDSILSVALLARGRQAGLTFTLRDLLRHQTIAELARVVTEAEPETATTDFVPFELVRSVDRALLPDGLVDAYPPTLTQVGLLYHADAQAASRVYHIVAGYRIRGPYSEAAWQQAVAGLLERHEILRSSFLLDSSEPLLLVHRSVELPLTFSDLTDHDDAEAAVRARFDLEFAQGFDWAVPPLVRYHVQRLSEDTVQLWVVEHHAILDGWSGRSLFAELLERYRQALRGELLLAPPLAARFRTAVLAERDALASVETRQFWLDQLSEVAVTALPTTAEQSATPDLALTEYELPEGLSERLSALAAQLGVPLRTVLLAAHLRVLALAAGTADVVTGVVYNSRPEVADGDKVAGMFLNTLPFRCRTDAGSWAELILRVAAHDVEVQPRRHFPMPEIQRLTGIAPLFETFFNYTHFHVPSAERALPPAAGASVDADEVVVLAESGAVPTSFPFGAEFFREVGTDRIGLALRRDRARYDLADAARLHGYYVQVLQAMAGTPDGDPSACLLPAAELAELASWNDTAHPYPHTHLLHRLVEQQAARTPDAPAVVFGDRSISYRELDVRANGVARRLAAGGVGPDDFVGVCMRRSAELVVGLLAILKAGAAYLPIEPDDPSSRIAVMLAEAGVRVVLCDADTTAVPTGRSIECPVIATWDEAADTPPEVAVSPDSAAYLIYTSGSTGQPKGVVVSHRAAANRLLWMQQEFDLTGADSVPQKTPHTFDVSVWEFFWPLISGARLVVCRPGGHRDPAYLFELMERERITTLHFVPSMLRAFLEHLDQASERSPRIGRLPASLRRVMCSGEALQPELRDRFFEHAPDVELVNLYGPTEAAIDVSWWRCRPGDRGAVPIGRPIANVQLHVLDTALQPVPVGVGGEIYIGGVGLAEGYYHQPGLTAERFAAHRLTDGRLERLYRTGDRGRWLRGGELEYLGRLDNQVKIRGFRVEPGEIETALASHPRIRGCAVLVVEERLTAYLVADPPSPAVAELRAWLLERLPAHMVPADWVWLAEFPLTSSGKLDRKRLPAPVRGEQDRTGHIPPSTPLQRRLAELWQELLSVERVGLTDRFADLGGHSLLALKLSVALRTTLGCSVSLADLLDNDTVGKLAARIADQLRPGEEGSAGDRQAAEDAAILVPLRSGAAGTPAPPLILLPPAGGDLFCYHDLVGVVAGDHAVLGIGAAGLATGAVPDHSVAAMATRYLRLLDERHPGGPVHLAGWSFGALIALEMADRLVRDGRSVASLCMIDVAYPGHYGDHAPSEDDALRLFVDGLRAGGLVLPEEEAWLADLAEQPDTDSRLAWLAARFATDGGLDAAELHRRWQVGFAVFQAHLVAHNDYRPPRYPGDCLFVSGHETTAARSAEQWRSTIGGRFEAHTMDATHHTILRPPWVQTTAALLNGLLAGPERP